MGQGATHRINSIVGEAKHIQRVLAPRKQFCQPSKTRYSESYVLTGIFFNTCVPCTKKAFTKAGAYRATLGMTPIDFGQPFC